MEMRVVSRLLKASASRCIADLHVTAIQAGKDIPVPHPSDRVLLRTLVSITKPKVVDAGSSFLRRTEYIGNSSSKKGDAFSRAAPPRRDKKSDSVAPLPDNLDKESPEYILKSVMRSFEVTAANLANPARIRHPSRRNVKLVSSHPILPDLNAMTDAGGYLCIKFQTNPVQPSNVYDIRLDSALLKAATSEARRAAHERAEAAHLRDPAHNPAPDPMEDYEYYVPEDISTARGFKRKVDVNDMDAKSNDDLYTWTNSEGRKSFRFKRHRTYETQSLQHVASIGEAWNTEVALALNDGKDGRHQKAVYMYPVIHKSVIRPQRSKNIDKHRFGDAGDEDENIANWLHVGVESEGLDIWKRERYGEFPNGFDEDEQMVDSNGHAEQNGLDADMDAEAESE